MNKKLLYIILTCVLCFVTIFSFACGAPTAPNEPDEPEINPLKYYTHSFERFNELSEPIFKLPGCEQGIAPQSIAVWEEKDLAFVGGYILDGKGQQDPTLFIVDIKTGQTVGSYQIFNVNNTKHYSYIGGLAVTTKNLFMSCKNRLYRMPLNQFLQPVLDGNAQIVEEIKTLANSAFCSYAEGKLWVGDYYLKNNSSFGQIPDDRPVPSGVNLLGKEYSAKQPCVFGYDLVDTESEINWNSETETMGATPDYCVIIQDKIRGFTLYNNIAVMVSSYGPSNASIYFKKCNLTSDQPNATILINGEEVPAWDRGMQYNSSSQKGKVESFSAMTEALGITQYKGDMLLVFSSGTKVYTLPEETWKEEYATEYAWRIKLPQELTE